MVLPVLNASTAITPLSHGHCQPTKGVQLADKGDGNGMVVEIVAANSTVSHGVEMAMKGPDDSYQIAAVLNLAGSFAAFRSLRCSLAMALMDMTVLLGERLEQEDDMVHQYVSRSVATANCPSVFFVYRAVVLRDSCPR